MKPRDATRARMDSLDDLELELRKLPGVRAAGFDERDDMLLVQLHVGDGDAPRPARAGDRRRASRPVTPTGRSRSRSCAGARRAPACRPRPSRRRRRPRPSTPDDVELEVDADVAATPSARRGTASAGARLLAVLAFPDTDELEVHLILDGRARSAGRRRATGSSARSKRRSTRCAASARRFEPRAQWAAALDDSDDDERVVVAVALDGVDDEATRSTTAWRPARARSTPPPARRSTR